MSVPDAAGQTRDELTLASEPATVFDRVGGQAWFDALVDRFYEQVLSDPPLRALYPDDLTNSKASLALFLAQYWGGPDRYSQAKGHPRLRMRHAGIAITTVERDAWFAAMCSALIAAELPPELESEMLHYFDRSATWMINA